MVLKYHLSPYPALLENMVVRIWEAESDGPNGWVYEEVIPEKDINGVPTPGAGHQVMNTITVNGLDKVVHVVRLYSQNSAALLHEYNVEPTTDLVTVFEPIRFKIGDGGQYTPDVDTDTFGHPALNGLNENDYTVFRNGYGLLFPGLHYENTGNLVLGGFTLAAPDVFGPNEEFTIQPKSKVNSQVVNDSVVGKLFKDIVDIVANTNYDPAHLRKLLRFQGAFEYHLTGTIPAGYIFAFNNFAAGEVTGVIKFDNAPLVWVGTLNNEINLPPYCEAGFVFNGTYWDCIYMSQSKFINPGAAIQAGEIAGAGELVINAAGFTAGDVPGGAPTFTVSHNLNLAGEYMVLFSVKCKVAAQASTSNKVSGCWHHHPTDQANKFNITLYEIKAEAQNINITWTIIKL